MNFFYNIFNPFAWLSMMFPSKENTSEHVDDETTDDENLNLGAE